MLSVSEASERIQRAMKPLAAEITGIDDAAGRFLASDAIAGRDLPPCDNSAMDGFAVRASELPATLPVPATIAAGDVPDRELAPGTTLRIMTGAPMPHGADAVVIREDVVDQGDRVVFAGPARPGDNVRYRGQDIARGELAVPRGARLGPGEIGLLAALGHATILVGRRPRVAILSTGDELVSVDVTPRPGQIVSSNAYALAAQVREAGGEAVHCGIAPDQPEALVAALERGLAGDVLVTSGGVSVGDFDHVKAAFASAGVAMDFWKVAMKPGKPLAFGLSDHGVPVFGLPGNPVSSMVVFELFVRPALLAMQGASAVKRPRQTVALGEAYHKSAGRTHFLRARLRRDGAAVHADLMAKQGSAMLTSMVAVDALVEIDRDATEVPAGSLVEAILLAAG